MAEPVSRGAPRSHEATSTDAGSRDAATQFSLELNDDQLQIQEWVHDFAERVIRLAAHDVHTQILHMADMFATGITRQFPDRFPADT